MALRALDDGDQERAEADGPEGGGEGAAPGAADAGAEAAGFFRGEPPGSDCACGCDLSAIHEHLSRPERAQQNQENDTPPRPRRFAHAILLYAAPTNHHPVEPQRPEYRIDEPEHVVKHGRHEQTDQIFLDGARRGVQIGSSERNPISHGKIVTDGERQHQEGKDGPQHLSGGKRGEHYDDGYRDGED
eukprot:CAMPEP_0194270556 /NCGR_PEP_ID=MMETSP0169-20130528/4521_1 /TAXON_ID=218684 /ORGANISM="Corethron pennatum, Strain L29A3" /LENGTH=187 /DNA_ID=CAMNT_0039012643 /DNA_START=761 /DNA_END=1323 /DNA_ORIENTATION=-